MCCWKLFLLGLDDYTLGGRSAKIWLLSFWSLFLVPFYLFPFVLPNSMSGCHCQSYHCFTHKLIHPFEMSPSIDRLASPLILTTKTPLSRSVCFFSFFPSLTLRRTLADVISHKWCLITIHIVFSCSVEQKRTHCFQTELNSGRPYGVCNFMFSS